MKGRDLNLGQCIKSLLKKKDVLKIDDNRRVIYIQKDPKKMNHDLGNKSWGMIDFLTNQKGYIISKI